MLKSDDVLRVRAVLISNGGSRRRRCSSSGAIFFQYLAQRGAFDGFREEAVHAGVVAGCAVGFVVEGRECEDGAGEAQGADVLRRGDAVHLGHLDVHEDQTEWFRR